MTSIPDPMATAHQMAARLGEATEDAQWDHSVKHMTAALLAMPPRQRRRVYDRVGDGPPVVTRPPDLYEAHVNGHVFKSPTYEQVEFQNCDRCGEQYGARYVRPCPAQGAPTADAVFCPGNKR